MSFAFQALLFFVIYLPGAIFLAAYWGKLSRDSDVPVLSSTVSGRAAQAFILAVVLNTLWAELYLNAPLFKGVDHSLNGRAFLTLLAGQAKDNKEFQDAIIWIASELEFLIAYFGSLYFTSWLLGAVTHHAIRHFRIDRRSKVLRFKNPWHYTLSGEVVEFAENARLLPQGAKNAKDCAVYADILLEIDKKPYIYNGVVVDYVFDKAGELDVITLQYTTRTTFDEADKDPPSDPVIIQGALFYVRYKDIKNLSIRFIVSPGKPGATTQEIESGTAPWWHQDWPARRLAQASW